MRNFSRVAAQLMDNDAAIMIADSRQLTATISQLARQPQRRLRLGANARYTVQSNQGALENILALLAGDLARSDQCGRISV
jgi:3-deoxy-D-manno-octulosonic-acid transferase